MSSSMANYSTTCVTMFAKSIDMISEDNDELIIDVSVWTGFLTTNRVGEEEIPSLIHWESQSKSRFRKPLQKLFSVNQPDTFLLEIIQRIGIPFTLENIHWGCDGFPTDPTYETLEEIITYRLSKIARDCAAGRKSPCMQFFIRKAEKVSPEEYKQLLLDEKEITSNPLQLRKHPLHDWIVENENNVKFRMEWCLGFIRKLALESTEENKNFGVKSVIIKEDDNPFFGLLDEEEIICCSVCIKGLKKGTQAIRLPCLHIFHGFCIFRWLSENPTCPICRFELFSLGEKARILPSHETYIQ
ncbi:hypothetical protein ABFX02_04G212200 [Erythranthe guttata]